MSKMTTRSFTYLLPGLAQNVNIDKALLENVYLGIKGVTRNFDENIYCLFRDIDEEYEKELLENKYYRKTHEKNIYVFEYPDKAIYFNFVMGKYSEFPEDYKQLILKYHGNLSSKTKVYKVLYKDESLYQEMEKKIGVRISRTQEIGERITFERESFESESIPTKI